MAYFLVKRVLQLLLVVWGGATILFLLFNALPGDPAERIAGGGNDRAPNPQVVENVRKNYGFDDPLHVRYVRYIGDLATGDLGESYQSKESVNAILSRRLPTSLRLAIWAVIIESFIGIGSGMLSARRRNSVADTLTTTAAVVASAIPVFVLGFLVKQVTGVYAFQHEWPQWATFPTREFGPQEWFLGFIPASAEQAEYIVQPAFVLAAVGTAILARITRTSMLETMRLDHVRTARAKGLKESMVMRKHVLRNAMIPVITVLGIDFGTMIGAAVLTETVFEIRGIGSQIVQSAVRRDMPVVLGLSVTVILIYAIANLLVDLSYAWFDPRVRLEARS
jgi:oligopeptide transport system permease protein